MGTVFLASRRRHIAYDGFLPATDGLLHGLVSLGLRMEDKKV
uniref:Uncharacterized protein n=1 Tax=Arundo donax TaxID=35708 RepID=A0A0A9BLK1_ARUDO